MTALWIIIGLGVLWLIFGLPARLIHQENEELGTSAAQDLGNWLLGRPRPKVRKRTRAEKAVLFIVQLVVVAVGSYWVYRYVVPWVQAP